MNFYAASAIQVPTKKDSSATAGMGGGMGMGGSTSGSNNLRRNSSSSSLDVAATIFSSMQELEASGRSLNSLGSLSAMSGQMGRGMGGMGDATAALESVYNGSGMGGAMGMMGAAGGRGHLNVNGMGAGMSGMSGGQGNNFQLGMNSATAAQRDRLNAIAARGSASRSSFSASRNNSSDSLQMLMGGASDGARGGSGYPASIQAQAAALRRIEMEEMMLQQQQQQQNSLPNQQQNQQRSSLLGNLKGGYAPRQSSSRRGSHGSHGSIGLLDDFTPEELLQEVSRRQSQRRNSRDFLAGMEQGGGNVRRRSSGSLGMLDALSRNNSRDDLVELYNQMRQNQSGRANSLESFSSLALMAGKTNGDLRDGALSSMSGQYREQMGEGSASSQSNNNTNTKNASSGVMNEEIRQGSKLDSSGDVVMIVSTANPSSKLMGKKAGGNGALGESSNEATNTSIVTDTGSPRLEKDTMTEKGNGSEKKPEGKAKRNNSTASFDALLSVFGDELAELDREKNGKSTEDDEKSAASSNSIGFFNNLIEKTAATVAKQKEQEEKNKYGASNIMASPDNKTKREFDKRRLSSSSSLSDCPTRQAQSEEIGESSATALKQQLQQRPASAGDIDTMNSSVANSQMNLLLDMNSRRTAPTKGGQSSFPPFGNNLQNPNPTNNNSYMRNNMQQSPSAMMASLEAMRQEELAIQRECALREEALRESAMRESAFRELQQQQQQQQRRLAAAGLGMLEQGRSGGSSQHEMKIMGAMAAMNGTSGDGDMARLAGLFGGRVPGGLENSPGAGGRGMGSSGRPLGHHSDAASAMLARLQGLPEPSQIQQAGAGGGLQRGHLLNQTALSKEGPLRTKPDQERPSQPDKVDPEVALKKFLDAYGKDADKSRSRVLEAIAETEKSLATIHAWDRSQGLRKCHSRTVVKTRRSRAKIKAFLMGVDPPKEPTKKRKKKNAKEEVDDLMLI